MARTPGLLGIITQGRPFLMAVKRLDRRIDLEKSGLGQQRLHAKRKITAQPTAPFVSSIALKARLTPSSQTTFFIPKSSGSTASQRSAAICA